MVPRYFWRKSGIFWRARLHPAGSSGPTVRFLVPRSEKTGKPSCWLIHKITPTRNLGRICSPRESLSRFVVGLGDGCPSGQLFPSGTFAALLLHILPKGYPWKLQNRRHAQKADKKNAPAREISPGPQEEPVTDRRRASQPAGAYKFTFFALRIQLASKADTAAGRPLVAGAADGIGDALERIPGSRPQRADRCQADDHNQRQHHRVFHSGRTILRDEKPANSIDVLHGVTSQVGTCELRPNDRTALTDGTARTIIRLSRRAGSFSPLALWNSPLPNSWSLQAPQRPSLFAHSQGSLYILHAATCEIGQSQHHEFTAIGKRPGG